MKEEVWKPCQSTKDATLWLRRSFGYGERLGAWLSKHEPELREWINRERPPGYDYDALDRRHGNELGQWDS